LVNEKERGECCLSFTGSFKGYFSARCLIFMFPKSNI